MSIDDEIRELLTPPHDPKAEKAAIDAARKAIAREQLDEYEALLKTLDEDALAEELADATSAIDQEPHAAIAVGLITMEQARREGRRGRLG